VGKTLTNIEILTGRYTKELPEGLLEFQQALPLEIMYIKCKGKFIYFLTRSDWSIWNTLGMSGSWIKTDSLDPEEEHLRVRFTFADGYVVYFRDMRNFGTLKFCPTPSELARKLKTLGPDVLSEEVSDQLFKDRIKKFAKKTLPEVLMDQKVISGVGNYIKAEALYLAKLSPHRLINSLTDDEIFTLNKAIKCIIRESYRTGGSTFRTYADFNGQVGNFSSRFMVYGQDKDPLGNDVTTEETRDGRTTHWVPKVQS
jgi:DNA-formamidopyrimidine glycosylase